MTDHRTDAVVAAITARYPGTRIEIRPNPDPATADDIPEFLFVLEVPEDRLREVHEFALGVAFAVFADDPLPFLIGAVDPIQSARCFPPATAGHVSHS